LLISTVTCSACSAAGALAARSRSATRVGVMAAQGPSERRIRAWFAPVATAPASLRPTSTLSDVAPHVARGLVPRASSAAPARGGPQRASGRRIGWMRASGARRTMQEKRQGAWKNDDVDWSSLRARRSDPGCATPAHPS
jgi:hypothetical protein